MLETLTKIVALPDGEQVAVSDIPEEWWTHQNASGYVDPAMIAPDPKNPRRHTNMARLAELNESIRARGVRQQLVVTPLSHAPWVAIDVEHTHCFFVAVSGHRRRAGAMLADLRAVPIKVVLYKDEKDHRMDMSLLNKGQDDLSDLDEGYEIAALQKLGWKIDELSKSFGLAVPQLYQRMNLSKLHPDIQALLDPELPRERRLPGTVGGLIGGVKSPTPDELEDLCASLDDTVRKEQIGLPEILDNLTPDELRFGLQKLLLAVIKRRSLSSNQAMEFIRDRTLQLRAAQGASAGKTERFQPRRRKDIVDALLREITGSVVVDWPVAEMRRIFELSSREEVEDFAVRIRGAASLLSDLATMLEKIRDEKKPSHPDTIRLAGKRKVA